MHKPGDPGHRKDVLYREPCKSDKSPNTGKQEMRGKKLIAPSEHMPIQHTHRLCPPTCSEELLRTTSLKA